MADKQRRFNFKHREFTRAIGRLQYYAAKRFTILAGGENSLPLRQLCQVTFHKGGFFAQFTYFGDVPGLVARIDPNESADSEQQLRMGEVGIVAPTLVKYSHPPDGRAHFSQDGQVLTKIRRQSFPLGSGEGHLFEVHAFHPDRFTPLYPGEEKSGRLYAPYVFGGQLPTSLAVVARWWPVSRLQALVPTGEAAFGPLVRLPDPTTGQHFLAFLVAPPSTSPPSHLMVANVGPAPLPTGLEGPLIVFLGGWDEDVERTPLPHGFLAFMYPVSNPDELAARLGTLAYTPNPDAG